MAKKKINEATDVASSRSRSRLEKDNIKLKAGARHQDEFLKLIEKMFKGQNVDIMECDKVPEVVLDFEKKDKNKLN